MMNRQKGFTLIELLVVIAIIGILSAIVLASLNSARNKANDAKVQGQLSSIRAAAEVAYTGSSYGADCAALEGAVGTLAEDDSYPFDGAPVFRCDPATDVQAWSATHILSDQSHYWCVDSTGASRMTDDDATDETCPAASTN